ncbi:putative integral membrane protein [Babesia bovis T2Bo]|uniref:Uncharacterized protein n=1 Tax=Babesia bovis TaxID=5865 RepID=A7AP25_BABBO|nr:putative integral membrane protein [Babesia bovis T2Bo]EDO08309.1 putative integral membrane protein [Babesia bovis T2Bo]|eukprot:XP_001611877.1 hypothetical protein [Babesia bovis T2Bo]
MTSSENAEKKDEKTEKKAGWLSTLNFDGYMAAIVAFCLYMPDQVLSVSSKHATVSLLVPSHNTGIYMTKLYATKTLSNFTGSLSMLVVNMFLPANKWISSISLLFLLTVRIILMVSYYLPNAAVWFYYSFIAQAFIRGLFENNFYPLAADHMSVISLSYKGSKLIIWTLQVLMDLIVPGKATAMMSVHLAIMMLINIAAFGGWTWSLFARCETPKCVPIVVLDKKRGSSESMTSVKPAPKNAENNESMWTIIKRIYSPFLMCMFGWPQKNFYSPGIIPYSLVDRSLCHAINIALMFFTFIVTFVIHMVKQYFKSLSQPWGKPPKGWHVTWLFIIPTIGCMPIIYHAMHYPGEIIHRVFRNNRVTTTLLYVILVCSTTVLDTFGYIGVSACSKDELGRRGKNANRIIAMTSFSAQFVTSVTYRMSTGYLIVWKKYVDDIANVAPTEDMNWFGRVGFWISNSVREGGYDFVDEFKGNIWEIVKDEA